MFATAPKNTEQQPAALLHGGRSQTGSAQMLSRAAVPIQRMVTGSGAVVQRNMDGLIEAVKNGDKARFKDVFRAMQPGQDEWISCETTYHEAVRIYNAEGEDAARTFLARSDSIRFPTPFMAHHVTHPGAATAASSASSQFIHPTSPDTLPYGAPMSDKGNPRWVGHTSFDRARAAHVAAGTDADDMSDRAIAFSTRRGAQPPFASNSVTPQSLTDPAARAAHEHREYLKSQHSSHDPSASQPYDAPWLPDGDLGSTSPPRHLPDDDEDEMSS